MADDSPAELWRRAEAAARDWMRANGFPDAELTAPGADGGIDVVAQGAVAQVKATSKPIGRPDVQRLHGIAQAESCRSLFFSFSGFTDAAVEWADRVGMALLGLELGPVALNAHADGVVAGEVQIEAHEDDAPVVPAAALTAGDVVATSSGLGRRAQTVRQRGLLEDTIVRVTFEDGTTHQFKGHQRVQLAARPS